jgi:hypothetical protein
VKPVTVHQELRVLRRMLNVTVRKNFFLRIHVLASNFPLSSSACSNRTISLGRNSSGLSDRALRSCATSFASSRRPACGSTGNFFPCGSPAHPIAVDAFRNQLSLAGPGDWLFPSHRTKGQRYKSTKGIWRAALHKAGVSYFRIYDLRSTYATRLSAGGVADEWVVQLLRQGNSDVFKKYSQMKLAMKREALEQINRRANEMSIDEAPVAPVYGGFGTVLVH